MTSIRFGGLGRVGPLGLGTWRMGEESARRADEIEAIREGLALGMGLIDTAEMYGGGDTERLVGEAIAGRRDEVFLVSKAYPQHGTREGLARACEASLRRLRTDRLDLYLLHWRGGVPLAETVAGLEALKQAGKILAWGVSNFDTDDMEELAAAGGKGCATNQILYNLTRRGAEFDLLPYLAAQGIPAMAYSPVEQGRLVRHPGLMAVARRLEATPAQVALAWLLHQGNVIPIPKAGTVAHVRENRDAGEVVLSPESLAELDRAFAPPTRKTALAML